MEERKGLSLIEVIVVIVIIFVLLGLLMPLFTGIRKSPIRVICGTNLKGLGTAMTVYANDYNGNYPELKGTGPWSKVLGFAYDLTEPDFKDGGAQDNVGRTITASWYMLVREADVAPKSFVCPVSDQEEFDGKNPLNRDIVELWDFGPDPYKYVSYVMHNPYGRFPSHEKLPASFVVAADMNPYMENGDFISNPKDTVLHKKADPSSPFLNQLYNASHHGTEGQNVLYADGHSSWETRPDVGVKNDNIYTYWRIKTDEKPNELDQRIGQPPTGRSPENDAKDKDDSFLAI
jgi:prepilin-type processing-associated H-X9-DG protein